MFSSDYETIAVPHFFENGFVGIDYEYRPRPKVIAFLSSEPQLLKPMELKNDLPKI